MYIFDTREKKNGHILKYFDKHGIEYKIQKLDVGDYALEDNPGIVIDRKQNLEECMSNLCLRQDKQRFMREVRRAHDAGIHMVVLCEHGKDVNSIDDVKAWHSAYTRVPGSAVARTMQLLHRSYGIDFQFCDKRHTAQRIIEILNEHSEKELSENEHNSGIDKTSGNDGASL